MDETAGRAYTEHAPELIRFAATLLGPHGADDLVADVLTKVLSGDRWREVENLRSYLLRAVYHGAVSAQRSTARRLRRELDVARRSGDSHIDHVRIEVVDAMRRLSVRQRAIVYLTYWLNDDAASVAEQLAVSTRTVERELAAARRHLEVLLR